MSLIHIVDYGTTQDDVADHVPEDDESAITLLDDIELEELFGSHLLNFLLEDTLP
jgi:hypothetical protein